MVPRRNAFGAGLAVAVALLAVSCAAESTTIHTVFPIECTPYFTWQSLGMVYSHKKAGQPGPLTRIMSCTHDEYAAVTEEERNLCTTHVAPSFTVHPRTGDWYSAYNKPVAVIDWLARNEITEDYVLIIDADMIMLQPFTPQTAGVTRGWATAAYFGYMKGTHNRLSLKHVPEVVPRNDTLAGKRGRRGDQVGGYTLMHREDLRRLAPMWLRFTEDVRDDGDAWELSGDMYSVHKGDKPWISEMYGYSYAASKADVWHKVHRGAMIYPGYDPSFLPMVLHYGLLYKVKSTEYQFDKHWYGKHDALACPPWKERSMGDNKRNVRSTGLLPAPPHPDTITTVSYELLRDLLSIHVPITLNAAFCERFRAKCPDSEQLRSECGKAEDQERALNARLKELLGQLPDPCRNTHDQCDFWAKRGDCETMDWMHDHCMISCKLCQPKTPAAGTGAIGTGAEADEARKKRDEAEAARKQKDAAEAEAEAARKKREAEAAEETARKKREAEAAEADAARKRREAEEAAKHQRDQQEAERRTVEAERRAKDAERKAAAEARRAEEAERRAKEAESKATAGSGNVDDAQSVLDAITLMDDSTSEEEKEKVRARVKHSARAQELRRSCAKHASWTMDQVRRCVAAADVGESWTVPEATGAGGDRAADLDSQGADLGSRGGDLDSQGGDLDSQGGSRSERAKRAVRRLEQRLADGRRAAAKRLNDADEAVVKGTARVVQRLGVAGLCLWGSLLVVLALLLPRLRSALGANRVARVLAHKARVPGLLPVSDKQGRSE